MDKTTLFERFGTRLGRAVVRHRVAVIVLSLLVFAVGALGIGRARFSTDYRIFFSHDDPGLTAFQKLETSFTKTDNVLVVVRAKDGSIFTRDGLAAVQELTEGGWKLPFSSRVDSLTNFEHAVATQDDIDVRELVAKPARDLSDADVASVREAATHEPVLVGSLLARDERTTGVNVTLRLPGKDPEEVTKSADAARALVAACAARHPGLEIRLSGMALINDAFMQASIRDMAVMMPLMLALMLVAMGFILRSAWSTAAVAAIISVSAALSMAVAGWLKYPLTPPAVAAPMIVVTVAIADGVHIVLGITEAMGEGKSRAEAIVHSIATNLEAVTYTWLTTIVGFVCLNYSDAPPVTHLANMTCVGVTIAFLYSVTLLPALVSFVKLKPRVAKQSTSPRLMDRLVELVLRRRRTILVAAAGLTIAGGVLASRLETNDQFVKYFDRSIAFRRDAEFTMQHLSGIYRLEFQIGSGAPSGVTDPAYLSRVDRFADWLRTQPEVEHVYGLTDVVKRVNQAVSGGDAAAYAIPATREAASQALLVYEMSLPSGRDLTDRVSVDRSAARLTVTVRDMSTKQMTGFAKRASGWLHENTPAPMWAEATGPVVIFSELSDRNARSMVQGDFVSLALISLCMIIVLRSLRLGLLSVVPNVVPIVVGYGIWKLVVGQMNIVASVAASISLGIIVDDTIHFLTKYQAMRRKHATSAEDAMRHTLRHVGPAMLATSGILVAGFAVLTQSAFQMTSYLGWLSVLIVGIAPLADLFIAPALVLWLEPKRVPAPEDSSPATEALPESLARACPRANRHGDLSPIHEGVS